MRGRTKVISLGAVLLIILISSMVFASGILDPSKVSLLGFTQVEPNQGTPTVFVDPNKIIVDYIKNPGYQIGNTLLVHVNVTDITDLFAYQVNVTWSPLMLSYVGVTYGDFLARTGSSYGTSRIEPTVFADNVKGFVSICESILGDVAGISGAGRLFTIQFQIVGYGSTRIGISGAGKLPTMLLSSVKDAPPIVFTSANGFFRNKLVGDIDADHDVDGVDFGIFAPKYGSSGPLGYSECDLDYDGDVDGVDFGIFAPNYGRSF